MKAETLAIHVGSDIDPTTGAVVNPIVLATTFERDHDGGYSRGYQYSRGANPNRKSLELCLSQLEGGEDAAAFSSGSAAAAAVFTALGAGDHVIVPDDMYHGITFMLKEVFSRWNLEVTYVNMGDLDAVGKAFQENTKLLWVETPSNPMMKVYDLEKLSRIAKQHNAVSVCDNTFCTPVSQLPFAFGFDISMHSTTKYIGGHSDVLGGALIARKIDDFWEKIKVVQRAVGAVASPFDCYLTLRGLKTLSHRMKVHSENALKVAEFLKAHSAVEQVYYPGLKDDPSFDLAEKQMKFSGGMLSFTVKGGEENARVVVNKTQLFAQATSLGGVESLIEHRASVEGPNTSTPKNLIRVSVGLEHADDLIEDLRQAIGASGQ